MMKYVFIVESSDYWKHQGQLKYVCFVKIYPNRAVCDVCPSLFDYLSLNVSREEGVTHDSVVKNTYCSPGGPRVSSQYSQGDARSA